MGETQAGVVWKQCDRERSHSCANQWWAIGAKSSTTKDYKMDDNRDGHVYLSQENKILFCHFCKTKFVGAINNRLSVQQKNYIQGTPFWWFPMVTDSVKISRKLLSLLCYNWVERRGGFRIGGQVVEFNLLDVCLGLGLRVLGERIDLNETISDSDTLNLFGGQTVTVELIYHYLLKYDYDVGGVEVFCRIYILLGISEFLLPNKKGIVFPIIFKLVDDIDNIGKYNWGTLVYEYLVSSLCIASLGLKNESAAKHFDVVGCVYLLQLWSFDHLLVCNTKLTCRMNKFPRLLHWMNVKVGDKVIMRSFDNKMCVVDVSVSDEELRHDVVKEAFKQFGNAYRNEEKKEKEEVLRLLEYEEGEIASMEHSISELEEMVAKVEGEVGNEDSPNDGCADDVFDDDDDEDDEICDDPPVKPHVDEEVVVNDDGGQHSNMYDRMKAQPRRRFKSVATRTPFSVYGNKKNAKRK
ncbi:protein MAINTENANCE OF MERISTEMS-like [Vigna unguiculata]|uniref:protein MAINTENANCE OF MERISTEMS-like n=1 Tax=Vigna unguiculata TaxID=3917 RepID=UPI001015DDF8|nr:protein MAINTENANCE OF MERISTEMS-like [Vigna unguiculata]